MTNRCSVKGMYIALTGVLVLFGVLFSHELHLTTDSPLEELIVNNRPAPQQEEQRGTIRGGGIMNREGEVQAHMDYTRRRLDEDEKIAQDTAKKFGLVIFIVFAYFCLSSYCCKRRDEEEEEEPMASPVVQLHPLGNLETNNPIHVPIALPYHGEEKPSTSPMASATLVGLNPAHSYHHGGVGDGSGAGLVSNGSNSPHMNVPTRPPIALPYVGIPVAPDADDKNVNDGNVFMF